LFLDVAEYGVLFFRSFVGEQLLTFQASPLHGGCYFTALQQGCRRANWSGSGNNFPDDLNSCG